MPTNRAVWDRHVEIQRVLRKLQDVQRLKLLSSRNMQKPAWTGERLPDLFRYLEDEVRELAQAIIEDDVPSNVWKEAADVANLAMMVADCYASLRRRGRRRDLLSVFVLRPVAGRKERS